MPKHNTLRSIRLVSPLVLVTFVVASCTKAVVVPMGPIDRPEAGKTYIVHMKDGVEHGTRDLHQESDDSLTFSSLGEHYHVQISEVDHVEQIVTDTDRTLIAVIVGTVVLVAALFLLAHAVGESAPSTF